MIQKINHNGDANKMVTAVEWLIEQFEQKGYIGKQDELQAIAMEKEQIINAFNDGDFMSTGCEDDAVKYYNETYNK